MKNVLVLLAVAGGATVTSYLLFASLVVGADLPPLPDKEGLAGHFAGVSHTAMLVAGGANFPDKKPWEGGKKVWWDGVFVLEKPDGKWVMAGKLPRPLGYGVSVTHGNCLVCVGGSDADTHHADSFKLEWRGGRLHTTELPALPKTLANTCGALVNDTLYVVGGIEKPDSTTTSNAVFRIDLSARSPKWEVVEGFPGCSRMLATAADSGGSFYLIGGVDIVIDKGGKPDRKYLSDAYRYDPKSGWKRIADLPHPSAAAPSPTPTDANGFYVVGCDDGRQWGATHEKHTGFNGTVLRYNTMADTWETTARMKPPRVTVPCVRWADSWVIPSGEVRPGLRSPGVVLFSPSKKE